MFLNNGHLLKMQLLITENCDQDTALIRFVCLKTALLWSLNIILSGLTFSSAMLFSQIADILNVISGNL